MLIGALHELPLRQSEYFPQLEDPRTIRLSTRVPCIINI